MSVLNLICDFTQMRKELQKNRQVLLDHCWEDGTKKRYQTAINHFKRFLRLTNSTELGLSEELLVTYAVWRYTYSDVIGKTVDTELSGICSYLNTFCGQSLNRESMHGLRSVLIGFKKLRPSKHQRLPITNGVLKSLLKNLRMDCWDDSVLGTILIFKKSMILRNSEGWKWDWSFKGIRLCDVTFVRSRSGKVQGMKWYFDKSKTNTTGRREFAVAPCVCGLGKICGPHAIIEHLLLRKKLGKPVGTKDAIFVRSDGTFVGYDAVGKAIKRLCKSAGLDSRAYVPHGLRSGGATDYIAWGMPVEIVKDMGRWKLIDSMEPYRKLSANNVLSIAARNMCA